MGGEASGIWGRWEVDKWEMGKKGTKKRGGKLFGMTISDIWGA